MAGDANSKGRKRRGNNKNNSPPLCPSEIVCTASDLASSKNSMEFAVLLSILVIGLYLYGFWESIQALPEISTGHFLGRNLNIARLEPDTVAAMSPKSNNNNNNNDNNQNQPPQREMKQQELSAAGAIPIPQGQWPVTLRDELEDFENLVHVGDHQTIMQVPKFWSPPLHNKQFFSREQAMQVGTCVEPDPVTGSHVRGDACPIHQRTIFISIASYRDYQCRYTLESAFLRAEYPERIRVGTYLHWSI